MIVMVPTHSLTDHWTHAASSSLPFPFFSTLNLFPDATKATTYNTLSQCTLSTHVKHPLNNSYACDGWT